jgi:peroxiredoxin
MARIWAITLAAFFIAAAGLLQAGGEKDFNFKGKLTKDDPRDAQRGGPSHLHVVKLKAGSSYTIDLMSGDFDSYLRLLDPKGMQLAEDDDGGEGLNSRIIFNCTTDGEYRIVATTFGADGMGAYILTVKQTGGATPQPTTAHARMIGKAAPDFKGDFAANGKPVALADLKGKVVLLNFWEVRSGSSIAAIPKLREWHQAHHKDGLMIVGVTFYMSEIGQKLAFDKDEGAVIAAKNADRASDQVLWKEFAAHHKIEYLLSALPKKEALETFDAYAVNGVPQLVLIDRQGMVRMIDLASDKTSAMVETEIKKLLAEK